MLAGPGKCLSPFETLTECRDESGIALESHPPPRDGLMRADASIHQQDESLPITAERHVRRSMSSCLHVLLRVCEDDIGPIARNVCDFKPIAERLCCPCGIRRRFAPPASLRVPLHHDG